MHRTAENMIRPYVIGRKNWMFADTPAGAEAPANIYSLLVSAKINNIQPYKYLRHVLETLPNVTNIDEIAVLMPHRIDMKSICDE